MHPLNLVIASFSLCSDTCAWFEIFSNYVLKFMVLFFLGSILFFQVNGWFSKKPVQIFVCELSKDCLNLYYIVVNPKRKFMFLFLKITSWFYLFSPHPSFFFENSWKDHECWGIVQVHCLWVPSQVFVFIYNSWFLQMWLTFVAFDDENLWM